MQLGVELALICLLVATVFQTMRLERALGVLKRDRTALEDLVNAFNSSTRLAEQGIERLQATADGAGREISRQITRASGLKDDLVFLSDRGDRLADRMEASVRAGRLTIQDVSPTPSLMRLATTEPLRDEHRLASAGDALVPTEDYYGETPNPRLRSQAERDLLKALRIQRS